MQILFFLQESIIIFESAKEFCFLPSVHSLMSVTFMHSFPEIAPIMICKQRRKKSVVYVHNTCSHNISSNKFLIQWFNLLVLSRSLLFTWILGYCSKDMIEGESHLLKFLNSCLISSQAHVTIHSNDWGYPVDIGLKSAISSYVFLCQFKKVKDHTWNNTRAS